LCRTQEKKSEGNGSESYHVAAEKNRLDLMYDLKEGRRRLLCRSRKGKKPVGTPAETSGWCCQKAIKGALKLFPIVGENEETSLGLAPTEERKNRGKKEDPTLGEKISAEGAGVFGTAHYGKENPLAR